MGRAAKPAAEKASVVVTIRLTPAQAARLDLMADHRSLDRSGLYREALKWYADRASQGCRHNTGSPSCGACGYAGAVNDVERTPAG